jgi:hypothetical protein
MAVGDSIKASLLRQAQWRLGKTRLAVAHSGLFRADLAGDLAGALHVSVSPVLLSQGFADSPDGAMRVGDVQVLGVDERFWVLGPGEGMDPLKELDSQVAISEPLARRSILLWDRIFWCGSVRPAACPSRRFWPPNSSG